MKLYQSKSFLLYEVLKSNEIPIKEYQLEKLEIPIENFN
jgi:hypothetical protein